MLLLLMMFLHLEVNLIRRKLPTCATEIRDFPSLCALSRRAFELTEWDFHAEQREWYLALLSAHSMTRVMGSAYTACAVCMGVSQKFLDLGNRRSTCLEAM